MRKIFRYFLDYQRKHFDTKLYLISSVFLSLCILFNYSLNFEDDYIDDFLRTPWHPVFMFFWQAVPFLGICFILYFTGKETRWLGSWSFWIRVFIGFSLMALDRSFYGNLLVPDGMPYVDNRFYAKCVGGTGSLFIIVIPMLFLYRLLENDREKHYYGLAWRRFDIKPYLILLGVTSVFIAIGSFFSDIQSYYPRFQFSYGARFAGEHGLPVWVTVMFYELTYGIDFISVEVLFRGFLIHGFARILGGYAVLPMVATYAFLHFGKPMTEAISSIFGGYLLGILSYNTKNVWGGIAIHLGIAWLMEFFGYLQQVL